ncbi:MAG: NAD(P)H-dependent oxidoreductase, partial [Eubacterium sp.]|nr:NAD(P)H-dependent oxidoreductase [Eubacterium sp.]
MKKKILFIDACARKNSRTRNLAEYVLSFLDGEAERLSLYQEGVVPLDEQALEQREHDAACGTSEGRSIRFARQFAAADTIVIASPHWDLS